jgi:hypothetical protein
MGAVFVSYRREDSEGQARALVLLLKQLVPRLSVFLDVDSVPLGLNFRKVIDERLDSSDVVLALIGKDWLDAIDVAEHRSLEDTRDYVRYEIAAAFKRNIPVTPVFLQGASPPPPERLPEDLKELAYRNGMELSHGRWESDVRELIRRLGLSERKSHARLFGVGVLGAAILLLTSWALWTRQPKVEMGALEYDTNLQDNDFSVVPDILASPQECSRKCSENAQCVAMTFVPRPDGSAAGDCWLKKKVGPRTRVRTMVSAVKLSSHPN